MAIFVERERPADSYLHATRAFSENSKIVVGGFSMSLNRRSFLVGGAAGLGGLYLLGSSAWAKTALSGHQVIGAYRHKVGSFEVVALNDGAIDLPIAMFPAAPPDEANKLLEFRSLPKDKSPTAINAFLVNTGDKLILIDSGSGKLMGPTLGDFAANLAAFGVNPASIDIVAMTHLHPDHFGGLLNADGKIAFPNAQFVVSDADVKFWLDENIAAKATADGKPFFDMARANVTPYLAAKNVRFIADGQEVAPGVVAHSAAGHTPGHTMYRVTSGKDNLLIWGDIIHSYVLQFPHPEWGVAFDIDPAGAIATRRKVFDMTATDKLAIAGAHVPFPGIGHVVKAGAGYALEPLFWAPA
jgi:glyoxylase-like metal-dependent hydrolase (beta-lactamase superfamily II)